MSAPAGTNSQSTLSPLSYIDHSGVEALTSTFSYVLAGQMSEDKIEKLRSAAVQVVDTYRLAAGHVEPLPARTGFFGIRVPLGPLDAASRVHFTIERQGSRTLASYMPAAPKADATVFGDQASSPGKHDMTMHAPPMHLFKHKSTTGVLSALAKSKAPLVNVHITILSDYTCVGLSFPHGVFDGKGSGNIVAGINAYLHGKTWTPPTFGPSNVLQDTFEGWNAAADALESAGGIIDQPGPYVETLKREFVPLGVSTGAKLAFHLGREILWYKAEDRALFLSRETIDKIVGPVKAAIKAKDPKSFVSTGDVLLMWFVRAAHSTEDIKEGDQISLLSAVCMREILSSVDSQFAKYPHNCMTSCTLPLADKKALVQTGDLADFALTHRKALDEMRNLKFIKSWVHHMHKNGSSSIPARGNGYDAWLCTNQVQGHVTDIDFGMQLSGYFFLMNVMPDHVVLVNEMNGGYLLQSTMRRSHWAAVDEAIAKLGNTHASVVKA